MSQPYITCEHCGDHDGFHRDICPVSIKLYKETFCKYHELLRVIKKELKILEPWYIGGSVVNPNDAIVALRNIAKKVNQ